MTIDSISTPPPATIHDRLPSGFSFADHLQRAAFERGDFVPGARKIALVRVAGEATLVVRLGPPTNTGRLLGRALIRVAAQQAGIGEDRLLDWYIREYNAGWAAGRRGGDSSKWDSGYSSHAWDDGFLDAVAGRPKWHLTHCADHDECGEG